MAARPLVKMATAEALLVLALGIAVLMRAGETPPPSRDVERVARELRTEQPKTPSEQLTSEAPTAPIAAQMPSRATPAMESVGADDPLGLVLHGAVQDQDGNPPAHWQISLTAADPDSKLRLDARGSRLPAWSMSGIPPGVYRLRCQAMGWQTVEEEITLPATPRVQRRDFRLQRSLAIKVMFDVPEAQRAALVFDRHAVLATAEELPERIPILSGGNIPFQTLGSWQQVGDGSLGKDYDGQILLQRAPPLYLSVFLGSIRLQSLYLAEMCEAVTFSIDEQQLREAVGGLRLRLVDASTGLPVVAAFVNIADGTSSPNEQGVAERMALEPGRQDLLIWTENRYATFSRAIEIRGGERLDLGDILLEPSRTLHGIVVDQSDQGAVAYVNAVSLRDAKAPVVSSVLSAQSRSDGRFDLAGLGEMRYLVRAFTADRERMGFCIADVGSTAEVRIELLPTFPVQITCRLGAYQECRATVRTIEGHALLIEKLMGSRRSRLRLPEGTYLVELNGAGRDQRHSFVVTQQGATVELP